MRIHLSNLRCEARTLAEQRDILERAEREARERAQALMKELANSKLKISQVGTALFKQVTEFPTVNIMLTQKTLLFTALPTAAVRITD